tara:strand:+ start:33 stop:299 length:267 start_codon:yes stop_codon:yes gene_type:complete
MFKKDIIDMVNIDDLREPGTLREFLHSLDHWTMIDLLEEQIINNVFDLATDEEVKDWYADNSTMSLSNLADSLGISQDQINEKLGVAQ